MAITGQSMLGDFPEHVSAQSMRACVEREIKYRKRVYPRQISKGKMTQEKADTEIKVMEAVLELIKASEQRGVIK